MRDMVMCKNCGHPREAKTVDKTPCGWCQYNPSIGSKQRRAERRAAERKAKKS
jgi:hypothetical protein